MVFPAGTSRPGWLGMLHLPMFALGPPPVLYGRFVVFLCADTIACASVLGVGGLIEKRLYSTERLDRVM